MGMRLCCKYLQMSDVWECVTFTSYGIGKARSNEHFPSRGIRTLCETLVVGSKGVFAISPVARVTWRSPILLLKWKHLSSV